MHLLLFVLANMPEWNRQLTPLPCVKQVTDNYFKHNTVEVIGSLPDTDLLLPEIMQHSSVILSDSYNEHFIPSDVIYLLPPSKIPVNRPTKDRRFIILSNDSDGASLVFHRTRLLNCVLLVKTKAYEWFPFQALECHQKQHLTEIDSCEQGQFSKINNFYEIKLPKNFQGCPLRVNRFWTPPYTKGPPGEGVETIPYAPEDEIMKHLTDFYNLTIVDVFVKKTEHPTALEHRGRPVAAGRLLIEQKIDVAYRAITASRPATQFDLMPAHGDAEILWLVPTPERAPYTSGFYRGFSARIWILVTASLVAFAIAHFLYKTLHGVASISDSFTVTASLLFRSHFSRSTNPWVRILQTFFVLYTLHVICFYESSLLLNLFRVPMKPPIKSVREAQDAHLQVVLRDFMNPLFNLSNHQFWNQILQPGSHKLVSATNYMCIVQKKCMILGFNHEAAQYRGYPLAKQYPYTQYVLQLNGQGDRQKLYFLFSIGNSLAPLFSEKIQQIIELGLPDRYLRWAMRYLSPPNAPPYDGPSPLTVEHMQAAFYYYTFLASVALLIFFWELIWHKKAKRHPTRRHFKPEGDSQFSI